jgi:ketosteroid isomerase-like protein
MKHPHTACLEKFYSDLTRGDFKSALALCDEGMTFQVPGKSPLAGKYVRENFERNFAMKQRELSGNTFQLEIHDVLASDLHATVLGTAKIVREGKTVEMRTVHVWRFRDGKPLAGYEYPRDLYQYDAVWGA